MTESYYLHCNEGNDANNGDVLVKNIYETLANKKHKKKVLSNITCVLIY